jgi:Fe-S cluster assembly iron-binding protein IscA
MLTLTDNASTAIKDLSDRALGTTTGGLRISSPEAGSSNLSVAVAPAPEPQDAVVENAGARIFLDANASEVVADKILDAQLDDKGAVRFALVSA